VGGAEKREPAWGHVKLCVAQYCMGDYRQKDHVFYMLNQKQMTSFLSFSSKQSENPICIVEIFFIAGVTLEKIAACVFDSLFFCKINITGTFVMILKKFVVELEKLTRESTLRR
jgi:hypothetical protein